MKAALFILFTASLSLSALAEDLTTTDGRIFTAYKITKVDPDGICIMHESGTAKIPFAKLPEALQKQHGYDPAKAAAFKQKADAALAAQEAAIDKELGVHASADAQTKNAAALQTALVKNAKEQSFIIDSVSGGGLLVNVVEYHSRNIGGNFNGNGGTAVMRTSRSFGAGAFVVGYTGPVAQVEDATISGKFAEIGTHTFTDQDGASRTVTKYQFVSPK